MSPLKKIAEVAFWLKEHSVYAASLILMGSLSYVVVEREYLPT